MRVTASTLTLLVARICTDHANNTFATDDLAVSAKTLDRCLNSHFLLLTAFLLFRSENDPGPAQIVRRQLHRNFVARKNPYVVHAHFPGNMAEYHVTIFKFYPERRIGKVLKNLTLHLDIIFLRHKLT